MRTPWSTALDGPTLAKILTFHVLPTNESAAELVAGGASQATLYSLTPGTPATLAVDTASGVKLTDAALNQASVTSADVAASNGVIHVIDKVLVPPGVLNVVQMAQSNPVFSVLVEAVVAADLAGALSGAGPFTVFAPTNDAFAAALVELSITKDQLLANPGLAGILTYHVVSGDVRAADVVALPKPAAVTTLQGSSFQRRREPRDHRWQRPHGHARGHRRDCQQWGDPRHRQGAAARTLTFRLSRALVFPTQGVFVMKKFFAISALSLAALSVQAKDIVDTAVAAGNFKTLAAALTAAGLVDTLKGKGPYTVFAPTDAAFAKIPKADLDALLADKTKLHRGAAGPRGAGQGDVQGRRRPARSRPPRAMS